MKTKSTEIKMLTEEELQRVAGGVPKPSLSMLAKRYEVRWQTLTGSISLEEAEQLGYIPGADPR